MPIVRLRSIAPLVTGLVFSGCSAATTAQGTGANGAPPAARVAPATASGTLTTLYSFQGQPDGAVPKGGVNVYNCEPCPLVIFGNTSAGGANGAGTVYELYRPWRGSFSEYVLLSYSGASDGSFKMPSADLPKLDASPDGFKKLAAKHPKVFDFMMKQVEPQMAQLLGEPAYDPATGKGFGCFDCHTKK